MQISLPRPDAALPSPFAFGEFPTLSTSRLRLRELALGDRDAVYAFRGDPDVQRHNSDALQHIDEAQHFIESRAVDYKARRAVLWGVTRLHEPGTVIGSVSLFHWDHRHRHVEIGYELARAAWGQGLAAEAARAVLAFAFERMQVHRVEAETLAENLRSVRLLERMGFRREGTRRECVRDAHGTCHDSALYGLLAREPR